MDDIDVVQVLGRFGIYHGMLLLVACLRAFPVSWTNMMSPLMAPDVDHWCAKPDPSIDAAWWKKNGIPKTVKGLPNECLMYSWSLEKGIDNSSTITCTSGWEYDKDNYGDTATSEWNLVCGESWKRSAMQSIVMTGSFVGVFVFGKLSDAIGRQRTFTISLIILISTGISAAFIENFWLFNIFRFVLSSATTGITASVVTMFMEIMPQKDRILMAVGFGMGYAFPVMFIPLLSYYLSTFRHMQLAIGLSGFILVPFVWCTHESPKWLLVKHRLNQAEEIILKILKMNKRPIPNMSSTMTALAAHAETESAIKNKNMGFIDMARIYIVRRNAILVGILWFTGTTKSYYLALNAHRLPGNPHVNFAISTFNEFPAAIIGMYVIRKCNRRISQKVCSVFAASLFTVVYFCGDYNENIPIWGNMTVRVFSNIMGFVKWVAIHEIFPTPARGAGFALGMMCSRIGAILAPFINDLTDFTHQAMPVLMFIVFAVIELICIHLLPETLNERLPDTVDDVKTLLKKTRKR